MEKFISGIDRLKGKNLFKGTLETCIRDVGSNQDQEAAEQYAKFHQALIH